MMQTEPSGKESIVNTDRNFHQYTRPLWSSGSERSYSARQARRRQCKRKKNNDEAQLAKSDRQITPDSGGWEHICS
jgi:hypothetical protein